ncbi:MAG: hypothetical protein CMM02_05515 [Rhodopirellula sp.]|nr:hypothetical protein [Rhodopirellula sp.]|tara:strand:+ start:10222 stop:11415 length:1194 start_codon:yes stop_codon:yes gene_type:complete
MKILYIDCNVKHLNPTANLISLLFTHIADEIDHFGPGYVSDDEIKGGILKYANNNEYDFVVVGPNTNIINDSSKENIDSIKYISSYTSKNFDTNILYDFYKDIKNNINNLECKLKLLTLLNFDYYAATIDQVEKLVKSKLYILAPGIEFITDINHLDSFVIKEKHYKAKKNRISNNWRDFIKSNPDKIISTTHFVSDDEFYFNDIISREYDINIPGIKYYLRDKAVKQLIPNKYKINRDFHLKFYSFLNKLKLPVYSNNFSLKTYRQIFQKKLSNSKIVFTAKGGFGMTIRKFFEIPAAGALMVCNPPFNFDNLGYKDKIHYIKFSENDNINEFIDYYLNDSSSSIIAKSGQRLTLKNHSIAARVIQIKNALAQILKNNYLRSEWCRGEFNIHKITD